MKLRTGDWVEVKSPLEILVTLDDNGTVAGLPFMPEMLQHCGRRYRVARRAEKTCIEYSGRVYQFKEFKGNDVVVLDELRCSGNDHDCCQRVCLLFWKVEWLKKVRSGKHGLEYANREHETLRARLKTKTGPGHYFCQSTALDKATVPLPQWRRLLKCFYEVYTGSRGLFEMVRMIARPIWRKSLKRFPQSITGNLTKTPLEKLDLQPGEFVKIKPEAELKQTLDSRGRNRGMVIGFNPGQINNTTLCVRSRLDRMILEGTGEMVKVEGTVILEGSNCKCGNVLGGCPRKDPVFWREIWLERVSKAAAVEEQVESQET